MPNKFNWLFDGLFRTNIKVQTTIPTINKEPDASSKIEEVTDNCELTETNFRGFVENLPVMFYAFEAFPPYKPIYLSPAFGFLGFKQEDWQNTPGLWHQSIYEEDRERVLDETKRLLEAGQPIDYEYRLKEKNGKIIWVRDRGGLVQHSATVTPIWQGIVIDVTEQKLVEQELKKREILYRTISRNIPKTGIVVFDNDLRITLAEGQGLEEMDLSSKMLEGKTILEVFPKETVNETARYCRAALAGGFVSIERTSTTKESTVQNYFIPLKNDKREVYGGMSIWQDITEIKQRAEKIAESEERYRELFDCANDLIYIHDLEGNYLSMNRAAEKVFGYSHEEILKLNIRDIVAPEYTAKALQMISKMLEKGDKQTIYEVECLAKNGNRVILEVNSSVIFRDEEPLHIQGIARDVTERKLIDQKIQESEAELGALFAAMKEVVIVVDSNGRFLKIPPTNPSLLIKPPNELIGKTVHEVFDKEKADFFLAKINEAVSKRESVNIEYSIELQEQIRWFSSIISPMPNSCVVIVARDVTKGKNAEIALQESEKKYRNLFENANDLIYTTDFEGNITSINRACEKITGYTKSEVNRGRVNVSRIVVPEYLGLVKQEVENKLAGKKAIPYELEILTKKGNRVSIEFNTKLIEQNGKPIGFQGIGRDITDRKKAESALAASESQYRFLSEGIMHQVWTAQPNGKLDYINTRALEYFKKSIEQMAVENWLGAVHPEDLPETINRWKSALETGDHFVNEFRLRRHDGVYRWHRALATAGRDSNGKILKWFGTNTDIHDQKLAEDKLTHFAKHDVLTNLPNRIKFMSHLERIINRAEFSSESKFAVLFLDLDGFKRINDSLGHSIGDQLLISFAERLEACVRPDDVVARLGGDEFTILLNNLTEVNDAIRITTRLIQKIAEPFHLNDYEVFTSSSIGIVVTDDTRRTPEDFLRDADTAMYRAKESGKSGFEIFNSEMLVRNNTLRKVESDLRRAVERDEFRVVYQPIISIDTGDICEFEALIRWQHPEYGLIEPSEFLQVAEETGLIIPIGNWMIKEAARQTVDWKERFPDSNPFSICINLSAKQLMHPPLIAKILEVFAETNLNPNSLIIEVTESVVMRNDRISLNVLNELKKLGVSLSTDDFGTGHSSLSFLHRFPFDSLKIDGSCIGQIDTDKKSCDIVRTILILAQSLSLKVVAEGIETEAQLKQLQMLGCKFGQGYLFSKAVDSMEIERLLSEESKGKRFTVPIESYQNIQQSTEIH